MVQNKQKTQTDTKLKLHTASEQWLLNCLAMLLPMGHVIQYWKLQRSHMKKKYTINVRHSFKNFKSWSETANAKIFTSEVHQVSCKRLQVEYSYGIERSQEYTRNNAMFTL